MLTHTHIHTLTHTHTHTHAHLSTYYHSYLLTQHHTYVNTHTHTLTHTPVNILPFTPLNTAPHICQHTHTHTDTKLDTDGSSSNWILTSCQPHRVTSRHSNSAQKQIHLSKLLFSRIIIYQPSVKSIYKTNHFTNINDKTYMNTQTSHINFQRVSPFNITPVKRVHKARTCWYRQPFHLIY